MSSSDDDLKTSAGGPAARGADTVIDEPPDDGPGSTQVDLPSEDARDVDASPRQLSDLGFERYERRRLLGEGGMGKVDLCFDHQIGREVAVKELLEGAGKRRRSRDRFVREARVQAQLEHPGVAPVYDLGVTPGGQPYFAMKRFRGITLGEVVAGVREGRPDLVERFPLRARLNVIERVCETVAYAHSRGVVHRDLKPANVMIGDFGEVNVLDWGIAKLRTDSDLEESSTDEGVPAYTVPGAVVGTPGYMSPEQATGDEVDARADVYGLGAMLFEVCALETLHRGSGGDRMRSTVEGVDGRPSARRGDDTIAPPLDAICVRATAGEPAARYDDASAMLEALRDHLEGEHRAEVRRDVATEHAAAARLSLASPRIGASETVRVQALRQLGAAAVLDPENREMAQMIERLLTPDDDRVPEAVEDAIEEARRDGASRAAGRSALAYAAAIAVLPILLVMGVRDWPTYGAFAGLLVFMALGAAILWRTRRAAGLVAFLSVPVAFATISLFGAVLGPTLLVPGLAGATAVAITVAQRADMRLRGFVNVCSTACVVVPLVLAELGVTAPSHRFIDGTLQVLPRLVELPAVPTTVLLLFTAVFVVLTPNILVGRAIEALNRAERRQILQTHRLRAMLPGA